MGIVNVDEIDKDIIDDDILNITGLRRISYDEITHSNEAVLSTWKLKRIQLYILEKSSYGCMISSLEERVLWFNYKPMGDLITPVKVLPFEDLLDLCSEEDSNILLFNLDIFVPGER